MLPWLSACDAPRVAHVPARPPPPAVGLVDLAVGTPELPPPCDATREEEGAAVLQGDPALRLEGRPCVAAVHATAGAEGSILAVAIGGDEPLLVSVVDPGGRELLAPVRVVPPPEGRVEVAVEPAVSGELLVRLSPEVPRERPWTASLRVRCAQGCDREWTRYPLLLMHGLGGGTVLGSVDYFFRVPEALGERGVVVRAPAVSPYGASEPRAREWEAHLDALLAEGHRRVNVIAHSQGGIDARYLVSPAGLGRGDDVASVTTVGTPHRGTPIADVVDAGFDGGVIDEIWFDIGLTVFSALMGMDPGDPEFAAAMDQLSTGTMATFDEEMVDHPATVAYAWTGRSCGLLEPLCQDATGGELVDPLLSASYLLLWPTPNDGLVPVDSQVHGVDLGRIPADHMDEIGQLGDLVPLPFDHVGFYGSEAVRLRAAGF